MAPVSPTTPPGSPDVARSPPSTPTMTPNDKEVQDVWAWNLDQEFNNLLAAAAGDASGGAILALDVEFPGFIRQEPRAGARSARYQALRENVDCLRPIQIGAAVAGADGSLRGVWSFNLQFDVDTDLHTKKSVDFLRAAGLDFPRHKKDGIEAALLGRMLASSMLVGQHGRAPWWVTFSGAYDLGYLLKLLTSGRPLPRDFSSFDVALNAFCPRHHELRDELPHGSLDALSRKLSVQRYGRAHTAGSDALLTLDLFLRVVGVKGAAAANALQKSVWGETWDSPGGWYHQGWDASTQWDARWENAAHWNFLPPFSHHFAPLPPPAIWPPGPLVGPHIPALNGGMPMPAATFWNSTTPAGNFKEKQKIQI
mmetsp:Transcript_106875/g.189936  ORF Transcript_106875/g.189936 Transcript_106875/m.189936 type:complete len:368 (+) Transcript_106875:71-1174(+)